MSQLLQIQSEYKQTLETQQLTYYEELNVQGRLEELAEEIDEMIAEKNMQWYNLMGFVYGLIKLGFDEEFLLNRAPIELILISSKVKEIEESLVEDQQKRQAAVSNNPLAG